MSTTTMTGTKPTNGLLTDRLNNTDRKTDQFDRDKRLIENDQWLMTNLTRVFQPIPSWLNWPITFNGSTLQHHQVTNTIHLTLKMTSAQVVETSVTNNSSLQNYPHPDDHTIPSTDTPGFKPFPIRCYFLGLWRNFCRLTQLTVILCSLCQFDRLELLWGSRTAGLSV